MKNKLRLLFGVLRGFGYEKLETLIIMDRDNIEDWRGKFSVGGVNDFNIPSFIEKILKELIDSLWYEFRKYIDLDIDEYWTLYIDIYPKENRLVFSGTHKEETMDDFQRTFTYSELKKETQEGIDYLYSEYSDTAKFDFEMYGRWGDGDVYKFEVDGRITKITGKLDDVLWSIGNGLISKITGSRYWNDDAGADLDCRIWGDDIITSGAIKKHEYVDSGINLEITPDNVENFD